MKQDIFTGKMFRRLFVPSLCASVGLAFSDMADALVVGWRMGDTGLAAIGMTLPLFMVINLFMHGFGIGGSVRYAQLLGAGKREKASDSFLQVLQMALAVSCVLALAVNLFPDRALGLLGVGAADEALYRQTGAYVRLIALGAPVFFLNYILNYYLRADGQQKRASGGFLAGTLVDIGLNVVLVDTAGRLHNKQNLMNELAKLRKIVDREAPEAAKETLLILDATTGQNGLIQAKQFKETAGLTGIVLTKLDGTAKGGIVVAIARELQVPVKYIGVGEGIDDLKPFDAEEYVRELV